MYKKIILTLVCGIMLNAYDVNELSEEELKKRKNYNKIINNCIAGLQLQDIKINENYKKSYKKYSLEEYIMFMREKQQILLKKSICYKKIIDFLEKK